MKRSITIFTLIILSVAAQAQSYDFLYMRPDSSRFQCVITSDSTVTVNGASPDTLEQLIFPEIVTYNNQTYTVTAIADSTCRYSTDFKSLYISNTITYIGDYSFNWCHARDYVYLGTNLSHIGNGCFWSNTEYRIVFNAKNCQYIGESVFVGHGGSSCLMEFILGDSVQTIPNMFIPLTAEVTVGASVTHIGDSATNIFSTLFNVYMKGEPPTLSELAYSSAANASAIYVPCEYFAQYQSTPGWSSLQNIYPRVPEITLLALNGTASVQTPPTCSNHQATIKAVPNDGWRFIEWSDGNTDTVRTLLVDEDMTLRARFEKIIDSSHYHVYYTFENEEDDTMWIYSINNAPFASWWIDSVESINGNRGLYVGGVRRHNGEAAIGMGGGDGPDYTGGAGSRGSLNAYTRVFLPEGMYEFYSDYYYHDPSHPYGVTIALVPDSIPLDGDTIPNESILFQSCWWGESPSLWVPDSGYYNMLVHYSWDGLYLLPEGDTIGVVVDNVLLEKKDSVIVINYMGNPFGWTEGGRTVAYGDTVTLTAHPYRGYRFVRWFNGDTNLTIQYVAHCNMYVDAEFVPDTFDVMIDTIGLHGSITSICSKDNFRRLLGCEEVGANSCRVGYQNYAYVEIAPDSGYTFFGWVDGNTDNPREERIYGDVVWQPIVVPIDTSFSVGFGFEIPARDSDWVLVNGSNINRWVIDTAAHSEGSRALYISNDGGQTNQYDLLPEDNVYAYTTIHLDAATIYEWSYDWRGGRCAVDFVHMAICPDSVEIVEGQGLPDNTCFVASGMCGNNEWSRTSGYFNSVDSGTYKLVFHWMSSGWNTGVSDMAGAVDNVIIRSVGPLQWVMINTAAENWWDGSVVGGGRFYRIGDTVTLEAVPRDHFQFLRWENGDTNSIRRFVVTAECSNVVYTAYFGSERYRVSVVPSENYSVTGTGVYQYDNYSETFPTVTLTVVPEFGCEFVGWSDGCTDNPRLLVVDRDTVLQPIVTSMYIRQHIFGTGFENLTEDSLWTLVNGTQTNVWVIDTAAHSEGSRGLYISNDGGLSNNYTQYASSSKVYAYRILHLSPGIYRYSYDWRCGGESSCDYMCAALLDTTTTITAGSLLPEGGISLACLSGSNEWQTVRDTITVSQEDDYRLTFYWINDYSLGDNPAAGVDNINIEGFFPTGGYVPPVVEVYESICAGDSLNFHGTTYSESGSYSIHSNYQANDDTVYTLYLSVNSGSTSTESAVACDSYTWHGTTYTTSTNIPTFTTTNVFGCDSVITLNLTINYSDTILVAAAICEGEMYSFNGRQLTSAGLYGDTLQTAQGCDSVLMLSLTVNPVSETTLTEEACDSFTWIDGVTYTASTSEPTVTVNNVYGCDSVITLHLTIHYSSYDTVVDSATGSYTWQGNTYTESGEYLYQSQTEAGCDSIIVLQLTINAVGIALADSLGEVAVFPNPTTGRLSIVTDSEQQVGRVEVFDQSGRVVSTFLGTNEIDIRHLPTGTYTLRITLQNGSAIKRVIKQ